MHGYAAPKLDTVRISFIGVGSRGSGTVERLASIEGVEVKALCDIVPERVNAAIDSIKVMPISRIHIQRVKRRGSRCATGMI
jgi:predicted homoserine dehydrogenase-like protein